MRKFLAIAALAATIATPAISRAQGVPGQANAFGSVAGYGTADTYSGHEGHWTLDGSYPYGIMYFHFWDAAGDDYTCVTDQLSNIHDPLPGSNAGYIIPNYCYQGTNSTETFNVPNAKISFRQEYLSTAGIQNWTATAINLAFNSWCSLVRIGGLVNMPQQP